MHTAVAERLLRQLHQDIQVDRPDLAVADDLVVSGMLNEFFVKLEHIGISVKTSPRLRSSYLLGSLQSGRSQLQLVL
jgi:hypothetical protein